jgi:hypothetical protein
MRWSAFVWRLCVRGRAGPRVQWPVASGVRCRARVRTPEIQVEAAPGVGLGGWTDFQLTSPPPGQSQLKVVTPGQSQLKSGYTGAKVNSCSASAALPRERPTALQGMPAMHLRRAQPCTSAAHSHAPPPRTAVPPPPCSRLTQGSRRLLCRLARIPSRAGLASHHLPEGFCISYSASAPTTAPYPGRYLLPTRATPTTSAPPLATRCTTVRPRLPAPSRQTTRRRRLSPLTSENHPNLSKPI